MALLVRLVSLISLITWGLYLWVNVKDFGSQPECNDQIKYVVLFCTVRATANWLRHVWIAIFAIPCALVAVMLFGMTATIIFILKRLKKQRRAGGSNSTVQRTTPQTQPYVVENHWYLRLDTRRIVTDESLLSSAIYATVMLELTIAQNTAHILPNGTNTGPGVVQVDDSWTFGQVLAVVMIIVNVKEVLHYLWGEPSRGRQAQTEEVAHQAIWSIRGRACSHFQPLLQVQAFDSD
ncbi:hypothetical protein BJV77DRAFT_959918 [Russula vinacea]|nr:hypothetical protein BJV77DRAFT_959918 [Russula vinacea]